jgi:hypothetical protein
MTSKHNFHSNYPNMNPTSISAVSPAMLAMPLALIFTSRLLLTEKSSATRDAFSSGLGTETLTIRATMVTRTLKEIRGYNHYGIND